ncbi:hypothetical protein EBT25_05055 [bacterium]|nr:hypothetical protein [bacterium]
MVNKSVLLFVLVLIVLYLSLTYSYAGYRPDFPVDTSRVVYQGKGYALETDSVADRAVEQQA